MPNEGCPTQTGDQFPGQAGMQQTFISLCIQPTDNRDAVVAVHHQGVMGVAHHPGQFQFENSVQHADGGVPVEFLDHVDAAFSSQKY
jgi:hypothetical protein